MDGGRRWTTIAPPTGRTTAMRMAAQTAPGTGVGATAGMIVMAAKPALEMAGMAAAARVMKTAAAGATSATVKAAMTEAGATVTGTAASSLVAPATPGPPGVETRT